MIRSLYTAVSGLITMEAKQDVVTNNLANANTVGFKSDNLVMKKFDDVLIENYDKISGGKNVRNLIGSLSMGSKIDETLTDFTQGSIQSTDKDTDFAIDGPGFFAVQRNTGGNNQFFYTRDGHFRVSMQGYLVNDSGDRVLGVNSNTGALEPIFVGNGKISSDPNNNLLIDEKVAYRFNISDFNDYKALRKVGDNLYQGENPVQGTGVVKQKSLERSNVNIINEMVNMMTTMRSFETSQKIVQAIDETLGKAANEVGTVR